jgi:hypothetical protein
MIPIKIIHLKHSPLHAAYFTLNARCPKCFVEFPIKRNTRDNNNSFFFEMLHGIKEQTPEYSYKLDEYFIQQAQESETKSCAHCGCEYCVVIGIRPGSGGFWTHGARVFAYKEVENITEYNDFFYVLDENRKNK